MTYEEKKKHLKKKVRKIAVPGDDVRRVVALQIYKYSK